MKTGDKVVYIKPNKYSSGIFTVIGKVENSIYEERYPYPDNCFWVNRGTTTFIAQDYELRPPTKLDKALD